jgi:TPR repeat protein
MGVMLMNGLNGPAEFGKAGTLLRKACALGSPGGCFNLGQMLTKGPDHIRDPGAADAAHKEACRLGHKEACTLTTTPMQPGA